MYITAIASIDSSARTPAASAPRVLAADLAEAPDIVAKAGEIGIDSAIRARGGDDAAARRANQLGLAKLAAAQFECFTSDPQTFATDRCAPPDVQLYGLPSFVALTAIAVAAA